MRPRYSSALRVQHVEERVVLLVGRRRGDASALTALPVYIVRPV